MTDNAYETLLVTDVAEGVVLCTFNRPDVRNALDISMVEDIRQLLNALTLRSDVRALIFTGAGGKAFISGADIAQLKERNKFDALRRINSALFREIEQFQWPTIAAIDGFALGGGCELAMACDIRIASDRSKLGQPEVSLGIIPGAGATYRLPRLVGPGMARELIYTGRIIDAQNAADIGLVNRVVSPEALMTTATELATEIAKNSAMALRFAKLSLNTSLEASPEACMAYESTAQALLFEDEDKHARMGKFLERRNSKK